MSEILSLKGITSIGISNQFFINIDKELQEIEIVKEEEYLNNYKEISTNLKEFNERVSLESITEVVNAYLKIETLDFVYKLKEKLNK